MVNLIKPHTWITRGGMWGLIVIYLMLGHTDLSAAAFSEAEVRAAVQNWVRYVTADARPDAVVERMEAHRVTGQTVAYVAHLQDGGFCLCGADELVLPVYFYSPQGEFDPANPDYQYILWEIAARRDYLKRLTEEKSAGAGYLDALTARSANWYDLIAGREPVDMPAAQGPAAEPITMSLILTSQWDQNSPYNDYSPELTPGADEHTLVGCVATAAAQIMRYWKWPATGVGNKFGIYNYRWRSNWDESSLSTNPKPAWGATYWNWANGRLEWTSTGGGKLRMTGYWDHSLYLSARGINEGDSSYLTALETLWNRLTQASRQHWVNFAATTYNWGIMPDSSADPPDAGDLEVAKLSAHVATAVSMNWGVHVSTSNNQAGLDALINNFRYDSDAVRQGTGTSAMIAEVLWMRPVLLGGCRDASAGGGCHSWVVYGYNKGIAPDHQFLINMGWGGSQDGWYTLDSMPFNLSQEQEIRIAPTNVKFVGAADPGDGSPDDPYENIEEAIGEAANGDTLIFKAGSTNTFTAGKLEITRPLTLKGYQVTIQ
jgi:hypothetical protein